MRKPDLEQIFDRALAVPANRREVWLARACRDDAMVRAHIEALLCAHANVRDFMESAPVSDFVSPAFDCLPGPKAGDFLGPYRLRRKIGEGGCGIVYLAETPTPRRHRVAVKVLKPEMNTRSGVARFAAERQTLARMEHPNIARVIDAGAMSSGHPFFAMEFVRGVRITEYCDRNTLSTDARLTLFVEVCHAIQHTHQQGFVHRDIKPSNILVCLRHGTPAPKVIDFGIAAAIPTRRAARASRPMGEYLIGTPAYVSPEQTERGGAVVDPRSDIYSLGVLLYELLIGRLPFDPDDLTRGSPDEMRRRIRDRKPERPSHRLRTLDPAERMTLGQRRGTDASRLRVQLRGTLDGIVMRCLQKDRTRRYETAAALALEIERHLRRKPATTPPNS